MTSTMTITSTFAASMSELQNDSNFPMEQLDLNILHHESEELLNFIEEKLSSQGSAPGSPSSTGEYQWPIFDEQSSSCSSSLFSDSPPSLHSSNALQLTLTAEDAVAPTAPCSDSEDCISSNFNKRVGLRKDCKRNLNSGSGGGGIKKTLLTRRNMSSSTMSVKVPCAQHASSHAEFNPEQLWIEANHAAVVSACSTPFETPVPSPRLLSCNSSALHNAVNNEHTYGSAFAAFPPMPLPLTNSLLSLGDSEDDNDTRLKPSFLASAMASIVTPALSPDSQGSLEAPRMHTLYDSSDDSDLNEPAWFNAATTSSDEALYSQIMGSSSFSDMSDALGGSSKASALAARSGNFRAPARLKRSAEELDYIPQVVSRSSAGGSSRRTRSMPSSPLTSQPSSPLTKRVRTHPLLLNAAAAAVAAISNLSSVPSSLALPSSSLSGEYSSQSLPASPRPMTATAAAAAALHAVSFAPLSEFDLKRNVHNVLERKRRNEMKDSFTDLRVIVPGLEDSERTPKVIILEKAADAILAMRDADNAREKLKQALRQEHENLLERLKLARAQRF